MTLNKDFALRDAEGYFRYPYIIKSRDGEKQGYVCNPYSGSVPFYERLYLENIEEVINGVIFKGWGVRVKRDAAEVPQGVGIKESGARYRSGERSKEYFVSAKYRHLVKDAPEPPLEFLSSPRVQKEEPVDELAYQAAEAELDGDPQCQGLSETERARLVYSRIGQGQYRRGLIDIWKGRCAVTELALEAALIASHAKAWKQSSNEERLDPFNGLLLAATVDKLFDRGLISFADDGAMLLSSLVSTVDLKAIGLSANARLSSLLDDRHKPYLRAHRKQHGFEDSDAATA
uniref:HNH endonuclease n=1 Tax=Castellaniella defragrans TaxID=75697 RepID=UPI00334180EF